MLLLYGLKYSQLSKVLSKLIPPISNVWVLKCTSNKAKAYSWHIKKKMTFIICLKSIRSTKFTIIALTWWMLLIMFCKKYYLGDTKMRKFRICSLIKFRIWHQLWSICWRKLQKIIISIVEIQLKQSQKELLSNFHKSNPSTAKNISNTILQNKALARNNTSQSILGHTIVFWC